MKKSGDALLIELLSVGGIAPMQKTGMGRYSPEYKAYLKSPEWQKKRQQRLEIDNYECCFCGTKDDLQVHHKRYDNLGHEPMEDLATFCHGCHEAGHKALRRRRSRRRNQNVR